MHGFVLEHSPDWCDVGKSEKIADKTTKVHNITAAVTSSLRFERVTQETIVKF